MSSIGPIREFLRRYHHSQVYDPYSVVPSEGDAPADEVTSHQRMTGQDPDEHVIPLNSFEYRIGPDNGQPMPGQLLTKENLHLIELYWDTLVGRYGLDAFSTYLPFHIDESSYGIYVSQRGIRYLGHLLYEWSRAAGQNGDKSEIQGIHLDMGGAVFEQSSAFESRDAAFALAEEIFLRYQWFQHQVEILAAYTEDTIQEPCYQSYHQKCRILDGPETGLSRSVGNLYISRSRACKNLAPGSLFGPLLERALNSFSPPSRNYQLSNPDGFEDGLDEISVVLRKASNNSQPQLGFELAQRVPFSNRIRRSIPKQIAVFITRRESDSNTSTWTNRQGFVSLDTEDYAIKRSETFEKKYEKVDWNLQERVDKTVEAVRTAYEKQNWKGVTDGPDDMRYLDINGPNRLVVRTDEDLNEVELVDFGHRMKVPPKYGLHKS